MFVFITLLTFRLLSPEKTFFLTICMTLVTTHSLKDPLPLNPEMSIDLIYSKMSL